MNKKRKTKLYWWLLAILGFVLATIAINAVESRGQTLEPKVWMPLIWDDAEIKRMPPTPIPATPTPVPELCILSVHNQTDGELCYEVFDVGIGRKCWTNNGLYSYGSFPSGMHRRVVESRCGTFDQQYEFLPGAWTTSVYCQYPESLIFMSPVN